jgi:SHS2 domain-containing protein
VGAIFATYASRVPEPSFRFVDHTGDFAADLHARSREEIFVALSRALVSLITDAPASVRETETRRIEIEGIDEEELLVGLGNELLFFFETGWLAARVDEIEIEDGSLRAIAHGEPFDPERHPIARPVKAVTHHGAAIEENDGGYRARVIFDL